MQRTRMRMTVGWLLLVIAAIAVCLGAFRRHLSLGSFTTGVLALTLLRTSEIIGRHRDAGSPPASWLRARFALESLVIATIILGASCGTCLLILYAFSPVTSHGPPIEPATIPPGLLAALWVCILMRGRLWPYRYPAKHKDR